MSLGDTLPHASTLPTEADANLRFRNKLSVSERVLRYVCCNVGKVITQIDSCKITTYSAAKQGSSQSIIDESSNTWVTTVSITL